MREGDLALCVWLPLALADLFGWTVSAATMGKLAPGRADILSAWCLPHLAAAVRADDERARQDRLEDFFDRMASRARKAS